MQIEYVQQKKFLTKQTISKRLEFCIKKYIVEVSETAEKDLESILKYLRYNLAGDIIADKYKLLFKQELKN